MYVNTSGIVLRETAYRESSKILTVLTGGEGKLTVAAHGALRRNSKLAAVTQLLAFSEMTLYSRRDRWTMTEARSVEQFLGLRDDIALLSLGAYIAELTEAVADEDSPNPDLLPLCLNALYALSEKIKEPEYVKPAFELRLMSVSGFQPLLDRCVVCGREDPERVILDLAGGTMRCVGCRPATGADYAGGEAAALSAALSAGALSAARYILCCDAKKLFSFSISAAALRELSAAAEGFLLAHLDRSFRTLDYFKGIGKNK